MTGIIIAAAIVGGTGIIIGLFLGLSGEKLKVEVDEKEVAIREALPGSNCGGCGYAGCDALAKAIASGEAPPTQCPVSSAEAKKIIAGIMGVEASDSVRLAAFVKCSGNCEVAKDDYEYSGITDCRMAALAPNGGPKSCSYGCLGYGSCVSVCDKNAIKIEKGIAVVDTSICTGCGQCAKICPKKLIEMRPVTGIANVVCSSHDKGKPVMDVCKVGCIGCTLCEKQCEFGAITMVNNLPEIDYTKCTGCGKCAEKCPKKIISIS